LGSSNPPTLTVEVKSADVPRSENLTTTIWGHASGTWTVLSHSVIGPQHDGSIDDSVPIGTVSGYDELAIEAYLSSGDDAVAQSPPTTCTLPTAATSADVTQGAARLTSTQNPSCVVLRGVAASTTTTTTAGK
jgi:hypothetical protein